MKVKHDPEIIEQLSKIQGGEKFFSILAFFSFIVTQGCFAAAWMKDGVPGVAWSMGGAFALLIFIGSLKRAVTFFAVRKMASIVVDMIDDGDL